VLYIFLFVKTIAVIPVSCVAASNGTGCQVASPSASDVSTFPKPAPIVNLNSVVVILAALLILSV